MCPVRGMFERIGCRRVDRVPGRVRETTEVGGRFHETNPATIDRILLEPEA